MKTMIYVCPNGCHAAIVAEVRATSKWKVGPTGELLSEISSGYDFGEYLSMKCIRCKADASEIQCEEFPVFDGKKQVTIGAVYVPVDDPDHYVYWEKRFDPDAAVVSIPVQESDGRAYLMIEGRKFLMENGEVFLDGECSGQMTLDGEEIE